MMHKQTPGILSALQRDPAKLSVISPELQALMALNKGLATGQVSPVAPGPGGPISSVADQKMQQAAQQMQPQNVQTAGRQLQNALPTMQQNAQAEQAEQMLQAAQQAQQTQQSPGIAGLDVQNFGQFAEGGVVGFAYGGGAEFDTGVADEYQLAQDEERIRRLVEERKRRDQAFMEGRAKATAEATGQTYTPPVESLRFDLGGDAASKINQLVTILRNDPSLSEAARTEIAKEIQSQYTKLGAMPQPETAPVSGPGATPNIPAGTSTDDVYNFVKKLYGDFTPRQDLSAQEARTQRLEKLLEARPDFLAPAMANIAEERKAGLDLLAEREKVRKGNYDPFGLLLSGFATRGITGGPASLRSGKQTYEEAGLTNIEASNKLQAAARTAELAAQRLDYTEKVGNEKEALAARKEYDTAVHNLNQLKNALGVASMGLAGQMYGADARMEAALMRGLGTLGQAKPLPDLDATQMSKFREMAKEDIPDLNPIQSPYFIEYLKKYEPELLEKLQSTKWFVNKPDAKELLPIVRAAQENRYRELIAASKFGSAAINRAVPYNVADAELSGATR